MNRLNRKIALMQKSDPDDTKTSRDQVKPDTQDHPH
jgi:hypothetical protein